jgi:hypothetical protein
LNPHPPPLPLLALPYRLGLHVPLLRVVLFPAPSSGQQARSLQQRATVSLQRT